MRLVALKKTQKEMQRRSSKQNSKRIVSRDSEGENTLELESSANYPSCNHTICCIEGDAKRDAKKELQTAKGSCIGGDSSPRVYETENALKLELESSANFVGGH